MATSRGFLKVFAKLASSQLHWLYAFLAVPFVTGSAVVVPPFRVPDEQAHFFRAADIASGRFVESGANGFAEGKIDVGLINFETIIDQHCPGPVTEAEWELAKSIRWQNDLRSHDVSGTSRYSPVLYLPQAVGLLIGRTVGLSVLSSFSLGRILNGLFSVAIVCLAIAICGRGKLLLFSLALLPMALFMMGSFSQEAGIIAISLLCAALITRTPPISHREYFLFACSIVVLATARLPLFGLVILLWLPIWRTNKAITLKTQLIATVSCSLLVYGWNALTLQMQGPMRFGPAAAAATQMAFLRERPLAALGVIWHTVTLFDGDWYRMFVGRLGWLDIPLPSSTYVWAGVMLFAAALVCSMEKVQQNWRHQSLTALTFCAVLSLLLLSFFFVWTPVGSATVQGMQGRYLFGFVPLLTSIVPAIRLPDKPVIRFFVFSCVALCASIAIVLAITSLQEIRERYHVPLQANRVHYTMEFQTCELLDVMENQQWN